MNFTLVLDALRFWWKIAAPVALILAVVGAGTAFYLHKPKYTAFCELLIKEKAGVISKPIASDSKKFISNQLEIMRSQRLLGQLMSRPEILSMPELAKAEDKVAALARLLKISPKGQSDFYTLSVTSNSAEKAELVVAATSEAYLNFYRKRESEHEDMILQLLEKQRMERHKEMAQLHDDLRALTINRTGVDPFRTTTSHNKEEETTRAANPLVGIQSEIVRSQVEQDVLDARIQAAERRLAEIELKISDAELESRVEAHPSILALRANFGQLKEKEGKFQDTGKNLSVNPLFRQLQADIDAARKNIDSRKSELRRDIAEALKRENTAAQSENIAAMREIWNEENIRLSALRETLKKEIGGMTSNAKEYAGVNFELESLKNKYNETCAIYNEISSRILTISTEQRGPERVELFKPASLPLGPDEVIPWKKIALSAGCAFFVPFGLAIAWEQLRRRVTSRAQLEGINRISVVGEVTTLPARRRGSSQRLLTERGGMLFEESVDCLRTYLSLGKTSQGMQVLAVTSAVSQEGKTTLAAQLAASIARATGEPTLLIDGDMRSPEIHEIFATELSAGLAEVLRGDCPVEEAIETSFSQNLHVLTAGRLTASPHQLVGNGEFETVIEKLRGMYRHIVIDTPPILPASEALVLARVADTAVLCVRRDYSRMDQVDEAYRRMSVAGVNTCGAVLNGIPFHQYSYRYGSYEYNRPLAAPSH